MVGKGVIVLLIVTISLLLPGCYPQGDTLISNATEYGNTIGNINCGGYIAIKDGWMYYTNTNNNDYLYRKKLDGTEDKQIGGNHFAYNINVVGNWVYYRAGSPGKIYKVNTDGKELQVLDNRRCDNLIVVGNNAYYTASDGKGVNLYRIDTISKKKIEIAKDVNSFSIDDNIIYYNHIIEYFDRDTMSNGSGDFCKIDINGENYVKLSDDDPLIINFVGDFIYYTTHFDDNNIYRMKRDGSDRIVIADNCSGAMIVSGDYIFYSGRQGSENNISRINLVGSDNIILLEGNFGILGIADRYILFCKITERHDGTYFISDFDGNNVQAWP